MPPGGGTKGRLSEAVEALFAAFAPYPRPPHVSGCPHCVTDADASRLHTAPLRELTAGDLRRYASKAMTTWGTAADFKHFLPRVLELLTAGDLRVAPETVLGKLGAAGWRTWPIGEQRAIEEYLMALWADALASPPESVLADEYLHGLGRVSDDLGPFLTLWQRRAATSVIAARHLAEFIAQHIEPVVGKGRVPGYSPEQGRQIYRWLLDPATTAVLERAFFDPAAEAHAGQLSRAVDQLGWIRLARGDGDTLQEGTASGPAGQAVPPLGD